MALTAYRTIIRDFRGMERHVEVEVLADKQKQMRKNKITGQAHHCRPPASRRSEIRLLCSDLVRMRWLDPEGARREEIVVMEGYSTSGANMLMGLPIGEGTLVTLCGGKEEFQATVRHCGAAPNGYLVGVCFSEQTRRYVPEHLLDLLLLGYTPEP